MKAAAVALSAFCFLLSAFGSELTVDKRTIQPDDAVTITLSLDGSFAKIESPNVPLQNLAFDGPPSVSSEFAWMNGESSRRKIFTYTAHANAAGAASVGPVTLRDGSGLVLTLPAIPLVVMPDVTAGSNDPARVMRELLATNREPVFVVAQTDKSEVFEGEEVVVTWTLYSGVSIQQYSLGDIPKLVDFWTEELEVRNEQPQQIVLGGVTAQKVTIRRAALFPLRSGTLTIGPMGVHAAVMKRVSAGDPFGIFEGVMSDINRRSMPLIIVAKPLPPGPPVVGVAGAMHLQCGGPSQKAGGPVVFDVTLSGRANLRATQPPAMQSSLDGNVQVVDRGLKVFPVNYDAWMTRRWRYLVFPARSGALRLPALAVTYLTPAGERRQERCEAKTIEVTSSRAAAAGPSPMRRFRATSFGLPIAIAVPIVVALLIAIPRARKHWHLREEVRALLRATPSETRAAVEEALVRRGLNPIALIREPSDRGDAFRAFRSLIDAAEHDRIIATPREIAHRIRDLLIAVQSGDDHHAAPDAAPLHGR